MVSLYSNYKSPTEMVDSWIEETTDQASKYQKKTNQLKKVNDLIRCQERMMEIALSYEVFKENKTKIDAISEKKDNAKTNYFKKRVEMA